MQVVKREGMYYVLDDGVFLDKHFRKIEDAEKYKRELIKERARKEFIKSDIASIYYK